MKKKTLKPNFNFTQKLYCFSCEGAQHTEEIPRKKSSNCHSTFDIGARFLMTDSNGKRDDFILFTMSTASKTQLPLPTIFKVKHHHYRLCACN